MIKITKEVCPFGVPEFLSQIIDESPTMQAAQIQFDAALETITPSDHSGAFGDISDAALALVNAAQDATIKALHCPTCVDRNECTTMQVNPQDKQGENDGGR